MSLRKVKCFAKKSAEKSVESSVGKPVRAAAALALSGLIVFNLVSCGAGGVRSAEKIECEYWETAELTVTEATCPVGWENRVWDFSLKLLQGGFGAPKDDVAAAEKSECSFVFSPLSTLQIMLMLYEGSEGETREQITDVIGTEVLLEIEKIQELMKHSEDGLKLSSANSAWFRDEADRLQISDRYVGILQRYFDAETYLAPFDKSTIKDINAWCSEKTDGMIDNMVEKISDDAVIYLLNALGFDAEWEVPYKSYNVHDCDFKHEDGSAETIEMMYGMEDKYIENEIARGFVKPYKSGYSFAAFLPKDENMKMSEFIGLLDADSVSTLLSQPVMTNGEGKYFYIDSFELENGNYSTADMWNVTVETGLPRFKTECGIELSSLLCEMGICDMFDAKKADLSNMATSTNGNIFVSEIKQQAVIETDTKGTRAAAVTMAEMVDGTAMPGECVYLDRPFVYAIVDDETQVPIFMGVMMGNEL